MYLIHYIQCDEESTGSIVLPNHCQVLETSDFKMTIEAVANCNEKRTYVVGLRSISNILNSKTWQNNTLQRFSKLTQQRSPRYKFIAIMSKLWFEHNLGYFCLFCCCFDFGLFTLYKFQRKDRIN